MRRRALLLYGLLAGLPAVSNGQNSYILTGYVTRAASGSDFDVNGVRVLCTEKTRGAYESAHGAIETAVGCPGEAPYIGEALDVAYSAQYKGINPIDAISIEKTPTRQGEISGSAVIDKVSDSDAQVSSRLIRADGYRIRITSATKAAWDPPLQSMADVRTGDWIKYKGKQDRPGVLTAVSVRIGPNAIGSGEEKLREKAEYDPAAVAPDAKQNYLKNALTLGYDPKEFRPFKDAEMQARIEKIGASLVPGYQRALPDSDPARINFRFQLIDTKRFRDALALPSGIILIPHQVVERMQNDSQLAALLADGIARVLERQQYRTEGKTKAAYAAMLAGAFVPYGWTYMGTAGEAASEIQEMAMEQSGRVSLALLYDTGYDVDEAPLAWWLLASGKSRPLSEIEIPDRSVYLYRILGEIYHNPHGEADGSTKP